MSLNYRSTENIVGASNEVIKHNKFKINKIVHASKKSNSRINIYAGKEETENLDYVVEEIRRLQMEEGYTKEDILFLYRRSKMYSKYYDRFRKENLWVTEAI